MKNSFQNNGIYKKIVRLWLTGMLLFIPFQHSIFKIIRYWSNELSTLVNRLDELTIVLFLPLAIVEFYKNRNSYNQLFFVLLLPIFALIVFGLISGILNGNSLMITIRGIFDYIKFFFVIFIYAAFFKEFNKFQNIFRLVLLVAVFVGFIAFIEESWALFARYIIGKDIINPDTYFFKYIAGRVFENPNLLVIKGNFWRFGIYRGSSLFSHYNLLGLYCLFILTLYLFLVKKINPIFLLFLITGIFVSISRVAYTGFVILTGMQVFKSGRRLIALTAIPLVIILFYGSFFSAFDFTREQKKINALTYRAYAKAKATEVWKDHPVWGVGPGMFGGPVAFKYHSPVYEEYNFLLIFKKIRSLDQFWPQVLAEMGIIGTIIFIGLFLLLVIIFFISWRQSTSREGKSLFAALMTFTIIFVIYTFGGNLNNVSILFPFFSFAGIGLGCISKNKNIEKLLK